MRLRNDPVSPTPLATEKAPPKRGLSYDFYLVTTGRIQFGLQVSVHRFEEPREQFFDIGEGGPPNFGKLLFIANEDIGLTEWVAGQVDHCASRLWVDASTNLTFSSAYKKSGLFLDLSFDSVGRRFTRFDLTGNEGPWRLAVIALTDECTEVAGHDCSNHWLGLRLTGFLRHVFVLSRDT